MDYILYRNKVSDFGYVYYKLKSYIESINNEELKIEDIDTKLFEKIQNNFNLFQEKSKGVYHFDKTTIKELKRLPLPASWMYRIHELISRRLEAQLIGKLWTSHKDLCDESYLFDKLNGLFRINNNYRVPRFYQFRMKKIKKIFKNAVLVKDFSTLLDIYLMNCHMKNERIETFRKTNTYNMIVRKCFKLYTIMDELILINFISKIKDEYLFNEGL
jgi:hypothetical protein